MSILISETNDLIQDIQSGKYDDQLKDVPTVLCHNDVDSTNILWETSSPKIHLIDFEYSTPNLLGMDLISLMNELMCEYNTPEPPHFKISSSKYPSTQHIREMVHFYLFMYSNPSLVKDLATDQNFTETIRKLPQFAAFNKDIVDKWMRLVPLLGQILASYRLMWTLFYFVPREVPFDFGEFSKAKIWYFQFYKGLKLE